MRVLFISREIQGQNIADRLLAKDEYRMMFRSAEHQVTFIEEDEALRASRPMIASFSSDQPPP